MEAVPPTVQGQSLNRWPTRVVLMQIISSKNENPANTPYPPDKTLTSLLTHRQHPQAFLLDSQPTRVSRECVRGPLHLMKTFLTAHQGEKKRSYSKGWFQHVGTVLLFLTEGSHGAFILNSPLINIAQNVGNKLASKTEWSLTQTALL